MPVPLLVGGHAEPALRRAAQRSDGWIHGGGGDGADLASLIGRLHELRADSERADEPFEIHVISLDAYSADGIRRLEDLGVTDVIVGFRYPYTRDLDNEPLQVKVDALRAYADNMITAVR
jgi:alkanesulfonate monooxygenase SsuD/methylene tetrahydromethanopterin reductase-like flavin-dependent oxidoreductase (luciferase family)